MVDDLSLGGMNTLNNKKSPQLLFADDKIGGYKVIKQLGAGGMGQVYLVENLQMHKQYALKILPPHLSQNQSFIDRFRVEARVMADLKHPNIVDVKTINHDEARNLYFLVMEFIEFDNGKSVDLESLLKSKSKLDEEDTLRITKQLCSALDYAHNFGDGGVIHRDLKPTNIMIDSKGDAHITDFGLAKVVGSEYLHSTIEKSIGDLKTIVGNTDTSSNSEEKSESTGTIIGTYDYMSPEQREGKEATKQSDIYSLGMIIYKLLTGKNALGRFKLPSHFGLSEYWDGVIEKCLENDPEDRFKSVKNIMKTLSAGKIDKKKNVAEQKSSKKYRSTITTTQKKKVNPIVGCGCLILFVVLIVFIFNIADTSTEAITQTKTKIEKKETIPIVGNSYIITSDEFPLMSTPNWGTTEEAFKKHVITFIREGETVRIKKQEGFLSPYFFVVIEKSNNRYRIGTKGWVSIDTITISKENN